MSAAIKGDWPADKVERRPLASLKPFPTNARKHPGAQVAQIVAAMREFGWTMPILVDEAGTIIAGHGRVLAAKKLGLKEVPVMVAAGWTEEQKRAYGLADNRIPLNSSWDDEALKGELEFLANAGVALDGLGFSANELANILEQDGAVEDLDDADVSAGKEGEDDGEPESTSAPNQPAEKKSGIKVPLLIELARPEFDRWKKHRGALSDHEALIALLEKAGC